jgi:hypothetical protein
MDKRGIDFQVLEIMVNQIKVILIYWLGTAFTRAKV